MKTPLILLAAVASALIAVATVSYVITGQPLSLSDRPNPAALTTPTATVPVAINSLVLPDILGVNQPMSQWRGKILVVNFWATWCPPCREEMPGFSRIAVKYASNGVQFVGISIDTLNNVIDFQKSAPVSYPLLIGTMDIVQSTVSIGNTAQALPFTAIFDRSGNLHSVKLGRLSEADLEKRLHVLGADPKVE